MSSKPQQKLVSVVQDRPDPSLSDVLDSGQFQRAEGLLQTLRFDDPMDCICAAEVHIYFDRLDEAAASLKRVRSQDLVAGVLARYALAWGQWHGQRGEDELAQQRFSDAKSVYRLTKDRLGLARAWYELGWLKRPQQMWQQAEKLLKRAERLIEDSRGEKRDYLKALIDHDLGVCAHRSDRLDEAANLYTSAMVTLNKLERGRHYGRVLNSYGELLRQNGEYEESLSLLNQARGIMQSVGVLEDLTAVTNNLALSLIRLQRIDEAEKLLRETHDQTQHTADLVGEAASSLVLTELFLHIGEWPNAKMFALRAVEQGKSAEDDVLTARALMALGRVELKRLDFDAATASLGEALQIGERLGDKVVQATAQLYLAESECPTQPLKTQERLSQVRSLLQGYQDAWFWKEFERVSQKAKGERLRVTADNELIISGAFLPNWYAAKKAIERFLVKNALLQTGGNLTKAGQILGTSKVHLYQMKKKHDL